MVKYLYVDIATIILKESYESVMFELVPFGSGKSKTQRITMKLLANGNPL